MKQIIMLPGNVTSPFFENEISCVKEKFEIKGIISYGEKKTDALAVLRRNNIPEEKLYVLPKIYFHPIKIIKWLNRIEVKKELDLIISSKNKILKKMLYLLFYGMNALASDRIVNKLLIDNGDLVLYSFWLSRGAYAISYIKDKNDWKQVKTVSRAHRYDLYESRNDMNYLPFREYLNNMLNLISFISNDGKKYFESKFPYGDNKKVFYLGTQNNKKLRKSIVDKKQITIVSCSNVVPVKRLDYIVDTLKSLDGMDINWYHLGDGVLLDNIKKYALEKLAKTTINFNFLGKVDNKRILDVYKDVDADYFINLSDSEGIPVSMMEAASMGIPSIGRDVGGNREILDGTGLLLPKDWNEENFQKIKKFILIRKESIENYSNLSHDTYKKWEMYFDSSINYDRFFSIVSL